MATLLIRTALKKPSLGLFLVSHSAVSIMSMLFSVTNDADEPELKSAEQLS